MIQAAAKGSSAQELFALAVEKEFAGDESAAIEHYTAARDAVPADMLAEEITAILRDLVATVAAPPPQRASRAKYWYAGFALILVIATAALLIVRPPASVPSDPPRASGKDIVLPAPPSEPISPPRSRSGPESSARERLPRVAPPTQEQGATPAPPPQVQAPVTVSGTWNFSEQVREEANGIDCKTSGTLDLQVKEGLLDGTVLAKETCQGGGESQTHDTKALLEGGTAASGVVAFTTRVTRDEVIMFCRYSGQLLGETGRAIAGEVTCEARMAGLDKVMTIPGTWRATRK